MSRTPSVLNSTPPDRSLQSVDAINDLDLNTFLKLMIAELQNQDPLNPLDNKDMLAQISQIREVGATDKLTQTLESVLLGQNIASATNLIGAEVTALSDDLVSIEGRVKQVSIDKGEPKLHVDLNAKLEPSSFDGDLEKGTYGYRVVWEDGAGNLFGLDFSDEQAITTTGKEGTDRSVQLKNLPQTHGPKYIYRTDATGDSNDYRLVGILHDGKQATFVDGLSDQERAQGTALTQGFQQSLAKFRSYVVSLKNVSFIRPPAVVQQPPATTDRERPAYPGTRRPEFDVPQRAFEA